MNDVTTLQPSYARRNFALPTLRPEAPIFGWLRELDDAVAAAPGRYGDRHMVLDLGSVRLHGPGTRALVQELHTRDFRVVALSGIEAASLGAEAPRLPPILVAGDEVVEVPAALAAPMVVARNIRSGQEVSHRGGDVIIVGSVASGAEVVAAGSIHVYGTLQGRAIAGAAGAIFCQKLEAELLRIGTVFIAADDMPPALRGRPARAWRDGDAIQFAALS